MKTRLNAWTVWKADETIIIFADGKRLRNQIEMRNATQHRHNVLSDIHPPMQINLDKEIRYSGNKNIQISLSTYTPLTVFAVHTQIIGRYILYERQNKSR